MNRRLVVLGSAVALSAATVGAALASPREAKNPAAHPVGVVHIHAGRPNHGGGSPNLTYHGGPVMHASTVYTIFWVPSGFAVSSGYQSIINGYFANVAANPTTTSDVYYAGTQYTDGSGPAAYASSGNDTVLDTDALPSSGCRDRYTSVCVTDAQIQTEIKHVMGVKGWTAGPSKEFFLFTARGIGSCAGSQCAFSYYCAYHSWIGSGSSVILYANMPYAATVANACGTGEHPNGDDADDTLNVTSHEHNETITDPNGNAWYDAQGAEDGDKCAWNFGSVSGPSGAEYNQTINGAHYYLQQEWSNHSTGCVLTGQ